MTSEADIAANQTSFEVLHDNRHRSLGKTDLMSIAHIKANPPMYDRNYYALNNGNIEGIEQLKYFGVSNQNLFVITKLL